MNDMTSKAARREAAERRVSGILCLGDNQP